MANPPTTCHSTRRYPHAMGLRLQLTCANTLEMRKLALALMLLSLAGLQMAPPASADQTYVMPSESMEPAFSAGQTVTVDTEAYLEAEPQIGDAVVFHPPRGAAHGTECGRRHRRGEPCPLPTPKLSSQLFLKRVVALPGDRLSVREGRPFVNGAPALGDVIQACHYGACNLRRTITIPADHYFVMGDNSGASDDSRYWGPIPSRAILGKVSG